MQGTLVLPSLNSSTQALLYHYQYLRVQIYYVPLPDLDNPMTFIFLYKLHSGFKNINSGKTLWLIFRLIWFLDFLHHCSIPNTTFWNSYLFLSSLEDGNRASFRNRVCSGLKVQKLSRTICLPCFAVDILNQNIIISDIFSCTLLQFTYY